MYFVYFNGAMKICTLHDDDVKSFETTSSLYFLLLILT